MAIRQLGVRALPCVDEHDRSDSVDRMMPCFDFLSRRTAATVPASVLLLALAGGCGDDGGRQQPGEGGGNTATTGTSDATTSSTSGATGGEGGAPGTGGAPGSGGLDCSDPADCEYPSRGLAIVERAGIAITDPDTGRELPLLARIPVTPGPVPLVIWSHGGGLQATGQQLSARWGDTFAAHGYAVIHIGHAPLTVETGLAVCEIAGIAVEDCEPASSDEDANGILALVKGLDVIAVLDALPGLSEASVEQGGPAIDLDRVAVAGWSGGARGPQATMGMRLEPLPGMDPMSLEHPRPAAAIALSPAGVGFGGFFDHGDDDSSWSTMRGPVLVMTGENDVKPEKPELTGANRRQAFDRMPADGQRHLLYSTLPVGVGGHGTFNLEDGDGEDQRVVSLTLALASAARAFLDASLLDDDAAAEWLASGRAQALAGEASWENR